MVYFFIFSILLISVINVRIAYRKLGNDWFDGNIVIIIFLLMYYLLPTLGALIIGDIPLRAGVTYSLQANSYILNIVFAILVGICISLWRCTIRKEMNYLIILRKVKKFTFLRSLGLFIFFSLVVVILQYRFGYYQIEDYNDSYIVAANLGRLSRQILLLFQNFSLYCGIAALIIYSWKRRSIKYAMVFLIIYTTISDKTGSRYELFSPFLIILLSYNYLVSRLKLAQILPLSVGGLLIFVSLGYIRSGSGLGMIGVQSFIYIGEFLNIWMNSLHLYYLKVNQGLVLPWQVGINEFISFIPDQLLPWRKLSSPYWYMETFYPEQLEQGNGLAFGIVSQVFFTGGFIGGVFRGFLISQILLKVKSKAFKGTWYWSLIYISIIAQLYTSIRTESIQIFSASLLKIILIIIILELRIWPAKKL